MRGGASSDVDACGERRLLVAVSPTGAGCGSACVRMWWMWMLRALQVTCGTCVSQSCGYMPSVVYRGAYQPAVVTAYQPVVGTYAVAYRPAYPWAYQGRLVPYASYMPVYAPAPVVAYSPCTSCSACTGCSSCGGCGAVSYAAGVRLVYGPGNYRAALAWCRPSGAGRRRPIRKVRRPGRSNQSEPTSQPPS